MRKRTPRNPVPVPNVKPKDDLMYQVRRYKVITPLFGGGVQPGKPDPVTIVRGTEIRGQLRFWWRATRGGQFNGDLDAMRHAEEAIWGSVAAEGKAGPSKVTVEVIEWRRGEEWNRVPRGRGRLVHIAHPSSRYSYVAFPLREEQGSVWQDIEFTLKITYRRRDENVQVAGHKLSLADELEAASWAWETFGGIGARTRRGFGALHLVDVDGEPQSLVQPDRMRRHILDNLRKYVVQGSWPDGVPHLRQNMRFVVTSRFSDADCAWKHLFQSLEKFRQARWPDAHGSPFGRSKWPEPDEIRRFTNMHSPDHKPTHPVRKFPRGYFGLPIVFQFKDEESGDPPKTILEGREVERFASRLILRPLAVQNGAVGLAAVLQGPQDPPGGYVLKRQQDGAVIASVDANLTRKESAQIKPLDGKTDVIEAFLTMLRKS